VSTVAEGPGTGALTGTASRIVGGVRGAWRRAVLLRGLVWSPALLLSSGVLLVLLDLLVPLAASGRMALRWLPPALALGTLLVALARAVRPPGERRFALLAEERLPALENRLLTLLDVPYGGMDGPVARAFAAEAERRLAGVDTSGAVRVGWTTAMRVLAVSLLVLASFAAAFPAAAHEAWTRWARPADAYAHRWEEVRPRALAGPVAPVPGFDELRWSVTPPAYSGLPRRTGRGEGPIEALPGSRIVLRSHLSARWSRVSAAVIGAGALPVTRRGGEWEVEHRIAEGSRGITLEALAGDSVVDRRVVPVTVVPDQPPDVALLAPVEDLVLASGGGRLVLRATATDDHGVGVFHLQWTHSRGSGESYAFVEGSWSFSRSGGGPRERWGELTLDLGTLGLEPGDIVHVRAVARDRNDVTGPGESVSRTRIVRVARPEELDLVNTDLGAPAELPRDPLLSQRMILMMTERLVRERPRMQPDAVRRRAAEIAAHQGRLRDVVGEQVYVRQTGALQAEGLEFGYVEHGGGAGGHGEEGDGHDHGGRPEGELLEHASEATGTGGADEVEHRHDEAPILAVNRDLMRLHNLMWSAEQALQLVRPDSALPHQRAALLLIQELARAERVYPRGDVRVDPIDPGAARGEGAVDEATPSGRSGGTPLPSLLPLLAELDRVAAGLGRHGARQSALEISGLAARLLAQRTVDAQAASLVASAAREAGAGRADRASELLALARRRLSPPTRGERQPLPVPLDPASAEYFRRLGGGP
jgi:hypothetical protein